MRAGRRAFERGVMGSRRSACLIARGRHCCGIDVAGVSCVGADVPTHAAVARGEGASGGLRVKMREVSALGRTRARATGASTIRWGRRERAWPRPPSGHHATEDGATVLRDPT